MSQQPYTFEKVQIRGRRETHIANLMAFLDHAHVRYEVEEGIAIKVIRVAGTKPSETSASVIFGHDGRWLDTIAGSSFRIATDPRAKEASEGGAA